MFIIWGFGKRTIRRYGKINQSVCRHCNNTVQRELVKVTTWFTLFFIPIIPYRIERFLVCPICGITQKLSKQEFEEFLSGGVQAAEPVTASYHDSDEYKYAGKTPVQIEYLKQMEAHEAEKAKREAESANNTQ